jgi:alcohol dehydrogenase class IV
MRLSEVGIGEEYFDKMAARAVETGWLKYAYVPLNEQDVVAILKKSL